MKKAFLLPLVLFGFCCAEANAAFLNDSESFVIARSVKLGDTGISVSPGGGTGTKKLSCTADDPDCKGPIICKKDTQCPAGQYCKLGFCKPLCDEGKTTKGVKCADIPRTPNCTIKDGGHKDYCACTETSCGEAFKCATKDGELQCVVCPAGEQCGCPDKKIASGTGLCVICNVDADCADNEKCVNGGKNSAYCEKLSCPDGTRPINHDCGGCSDLTPNCETCTETQCLTCEPAYDLIDGKCVLKTCEDGQYLNMDDGKCYPCGTNCVKCSAANKCDECETGYELQNGVCVAKTCDAGYYLDFTTGECLACPTECATCAAPNPGDEPVCLTCPTGWHLSGTTCVEDSCADMGLATSCDEGKKKTPAGTATNGEQCYTCDNECSSNSDCDNGKKCENGSCVLKSCAEMGYKTSCRADQTKTEEAYGSDGVCYSCVTPKPQCTSNSDCAADEKCTDGKCDKISCSGTCKEIKNHACVDIAGCCTGDSQCGKNEKCINNKCEEQCGCKDFEYCKGGKCYLQAGRCYTSKDCEDYNKCVSNSCVDNCYGVNCAAKDSQYPTCMSSYSPGEYYCKCTSSSCKAGYKCSKDGYTCQQIDGCSKDKDCENGQKCLNKKCVDSCTNVKCNDPKFPKCYNYTWTTNSTACYCTETSCGTGYKCDQIYCKKIGSCDKHSDCDGGQKCSNGKCISSCTGATCPQTEPVCNAGTSFTNWYTCRCTETSCGEGYECIEGDCRVRQTETCKTDDDCSAEKKCSYGYCVFRDAK